ncbi:Ig-like domain-containing protein [Staphylococcus felis]|nr:Ig-like domain-containing protein [Staphylococcus felis]
MTGKGEAGGKVTVTSQNDKKATGSVNEEGRYDVNIP